MTIAGIVRKYITNRPLVERTVDKAIHSGSIAALDDLPRSGRPPEIKNQARAWVVSITCGKPTDFGYAAQTWTYSALAKYLRENCVAAGCPSLINTGKSLLNNVLSKSNIKPHKISYYLEKKDPEFDVKMASALHVYKEVALINDNAICANRHTTVSYDEKPGIQVIKNIAPQLQPVPNTRCSIGRDYEYKRLGTVSLLAAIDLHSGKVTPIIRNQHRIIEFIELLKELGQTIPKRLENTGCFG